MIKILFVCLGNICRSPIAQGVFEKKINILGLSHNFYVDSAGTSGWHKGERPHHGSIKVGLKNKVDINNQRSRAVTLHDGTEFDYIIAMDQNNYLSLLNEFQFPEKKVIKIRFFDTNNKPNGDVPDPYGHGDEAFDNVYAIINHAVENFIHFLKEKHANNFIP